MGVSVVIAEIAKRLLIRPELVDAPPGWLNNSFPSGHVSIGVGAMLVLPYSLR
jgi:membrane-associated phospholipid phosphatase